MLKFTMSALLLALTMLASPVRAADEPVDAQKDQHIHKLLELSGTGKGAKQVFDAVIGQMRTLHPDVPPEFWTAFAKEVDINAFIELMVPIYAKHFTDDDIQELIKFYESPVGKKLTQEQPLMMQESMQIGQKWGAELGAKVVQKLADKGYNKN